MDKGHSVGSGRAEMADREFRPGSSDTLRQRRRFLEIFSVTYLQEMEYQIRIVGKETL
ncbi:hypothetical protein LCGC14_2076840 [marine sediment metagenome]|uniref:Uncharacterized protein n=1 Tax=marine sediment metagenome TaxID=412755 RepID=A0A0F9HDS4_9ZZZZ